MGKDSRPHILGPALSVEMCGFLHWREVFTPLMSLIAAPVIAALGFRLFDDCGPGCSGGQRTRFEESAAWVEPPALCYGHSQVEAAGGGR